MELQLCGTLSFLTPTATILSVSSVIHAGCLTQHAPDAGDSAAFLGSFLRLSLFLVGRLRYPHPQRQ